VGDDFATVRVLEFHDKLDVMQVNGIHEFEEGLRILEVESVVGVRGPDVRAAKVKLIPGILQQHFHSGLAV
jgi:hypothetical protein